MKKIDKSKLNKDSEDLRALNSELGTFGLEPPVRYKKEATPQSKKQANPKEKLQKQIKSKTKSAKQQNLTREEKNAIHKKKRKLKKKYRLAFSIIALVVALCLVMVVLSLTVFFKIETISVEGTTKYDYEQVCAVLPVEKEQNLFLVDKKKSSKKLTENLPYIYSVELKRELPSTLVVKISEPEQIYYVENSNNTYTYFDNTFKAIEVDALEPPTENGIEIKKIALENAVAGTKVTFTNQDLFDDVQSLMNVVTELKLKEVTAICSESVINNYVVYEDRITIKIGETKDAQSKLYSALAAIEKLNETNPEATGTITSTGGKQVYFTDQK